mgnify:CR=1 FL=1
MHFATIVSFEKSAKFLMQHHKVYVSASTSRRQTEAIGACAEAVQDEQAKSVLQQSSTLDGEDISSGKQVISNDGSFISLRGGVYAEVKTAVIGEVEENKRHLKHRPDQEVKMTHLTYFSRMVNSETFTELATSEVARRGFFRTKQVCAVSDGAEWIQHFIDAHRTDAVRILDFYHASEYLSDIEELIRNAGTALPENWLEEQCHVLKHQGPKKVLKEVNRLLKAHPERDDLVKLVNYLQKREKMMQYPLFQQQGWPIGSGSVESANTCVVQSRLKGSGMHWETRNVNPMLALRTGLCNDRWEDTRNQAFRQRLKTRQSSRLAHQKKRYEGFKQEVLRLLFFFSLHKPKRTDIPATQTALSSASSCVPDAKKVCRPAQSHPWRRYPCAKK